MSKDKISEKRRKIVLASAAMPILATLKSGAALAASSATCKPMTEDVSNKKFPSNGNSIYGDTAVRYEVTAYKKKNASGQKESNYIYEIDGQLYHNSGYLFDGDINEYDLVDEKAHVLMLYDTDDSGTYEVGLWPKFQRIEDGGNAFPINQSCLTSIAVTGTNSFRGLL